MIANVADALAAYKQGGGLSGPAGLGATETSGPSFADALKNFAGDAVKSMEAGEKAATDAAMGKANLANVVTAINDAELQLQTLVTIRDKIITAYQTITQSAI